MKFTANRLLMYQAVKTVLKTVKQNKEIPEIGGILIEADSNSGILTLTGTDVRTHIQSRLRQEYIEESGSIILKPILLEMLGRFSGETVTVEAEKGMATLRSDTCRYDISCLEAKKLSEAANPFPGGHHPDQGNQFAHQTHGFCDGWRNA